MDLALFAFAEAVVSIASVQAMGRSKKRQYVRTTAMKVGIALLL